MCVESPPPPVWLPTSGPSAPEGISSGPSLGTPKRRQQRCVLTSKIRHRHEGLVVGGIFRTDPPFVCLPTDPPPKNPGHNWRETNIVNGYLNSNLSSEFSARFVSCCQRLLNMYTYGCTSTFTYNHIDISYTYAHTHKFNYYLAQLQYNMVPYLNSIHTHTVTLFFI